MSKSESIKNDIISAIGITTISYDELIDTIEKFREYIQTSGFWANSWAISTIEKVLNIKFIILSERAYIENDLHNVLICGESNKEHVKKGKFNPDYYIVTTFSGNNYQLVEYKDKRILNFLKYRIT